MDIRFSLNPCPRKPGAQYLSKRAAQLGGRRFAVEWTGFINVERSDSYTFTLTSDDGAWIFLDDRLIATTGQAPTAATQSETVALFSGPHSIRVRVLDKGHGGRLEVRWASAVDPPAALTTALFPTRLAYHVRQALPPRGYLIPGAWALFLLGVILAWPIRFVGRHVRAHPAEWLANAALLGVLALSVVLSAWGISWGLPDSVGWSIDEFKPVYILSFLAGQPSLDPPLHQYLLSLLFLPFQVAARLGLTDVASPHTYAALFFLSRGVSVVMAVGTVYVVYLCGFELFARRAAGIFAAFLVAVMPPFVYYAKTVHLDVPYVFWFSLSLLSYLRAIKGNQTWDYIRFASFAALAVCTKDQAYGFYVLPAVHVTWLRYRDRQEATWVARTRSLVLDRALVGATVVAGLIFVLAHNVLFDPNNFVEHVKTLAGPWSQPFRMFEPTVTGHLQMMWESLRQMAWSLGWPGFVLSVAGVAVSARPRDRTTLWALLPAMSYYTFFVSVILYHYDRFFLGVCLTAALFGGRALADLSSRGRAVWWRRAGVAGVLAYSALYGATVNVVMSDDARYHVEDWLRDSVEADALIGYSGFPEYLPRFRNRRTVQLDESWDKVVASRPDVIVVNRTFSCRARPNTPEADFYVRLRDGDSGYHLLLTHRSEPRWPVLSPGRVWRNACEDPFTSLSKINPEIAVYGAVAEGR